MNIENFLITLPVMVKGMGGIFAVTAVIVICMIVITKLLSGKNKTDVEDTK